VEAVRAELAPWSTQPPLLIKLAPELGVAELTELLPAVESWGIDGWVLTNTWGGSITRGGTTYPGGWSGKKVREASRASLVAARAISRQPIISVGGIDSGDEARARIAAGASLVQVYTGWIYEGPDMVKRINKGLLEFLKRDGFKNIQEAVGTL
jgi:dihydroorotate dehydrogenase